MRIAAIAAVLLLSIVGVRRWIHHAQLELVPVLVLPAEDVQSVVAPPPGSIAARMMLDVRDVLTMPARPRLAVLTFDDGPYPVESPALVQELLRLHVPADLFFIGRDAAQQPAIARRLAALGFEIGNHTLSHPEMPTLSYAAQLSEIANGSATIMRTCGVRIRYFRPPHGSYDVDTIRAAIADDEVVALWDVDPGDWRTLTSDQIVNTTAMLARAPAVILLHDGKDATIEALPRIVDAYRRAGFEFVTLSELERRVPIDVINDPMKINVP